MPKLINEVGNRYGRLTVLRRYGSSPMGATWLCECDCGTVVAEKGACLRSGNVRSCGCLREMTVEEREILGFKPHGKERLIINES
jgi:hypothetical protein